MVDINQATFKRLLKTDFAVRNGPGIALQLSEVNEVGAVPAGYESFSLVFKADGPLMPQAIYAVEHPDLPELDLFLVPIDQDGDTCYYESVFNLKA